MYKKIYFNLKILYLNFFLFINYLTIDILYINLNYY